ncbi:signal peptidase I [Nocardioides sp. GXQ0305]|uniref:signal peptidase I n=1 Tax=Nocardioides sp. GXQ0305 TaxID=3423912 RepID=UPI003D7DBF3C
MSHDVRHFVTQAFSWALLASVIAGALALIVIPKANDARPLTVLTGSMTGTYDAGSVVIVRDVDPETVQVGDVITFQALSDNPALTTHRVVDIAYGSEGTTYVTKGDANDAVDPWTVTAEQIKGEVWYSVPFVGYPSTWLASGWLHVAVQVIAVGLLIYGGWFLTSGAVERLRGNGRRREDGDADADPDVSALPAELQLDVRPQPLALMAPSRKTPAALPAPATMAALPVAAPKAAAKKAAPRKAAAKKAPAKKAPAKKAPATRAPAKKAAPKKAAPRKAAAKKAPAKKAPATRAPAKKAAPRKAPATKVLVTAGAAS